MPKKEDKILEKEAKKIAKEAKKGTVKTVAEKPVYIMCPKCELNFILKSDKYCTVCKATLGLIDKSLLIPDDDEAVGEKLCSMCNNTYIADDELICFLCLKEKERLAETAEWEPDVIAEPEPEPEPEVEEELTIVMADDDEEDNEDDEDYSDQYKEPEDLDYSINEDDFLDRDEEDDDYDEEDDEDF